MMKWIMEDDDELRCSNCDYPVSARYGNSNENENKVVSLPSCCPNCGEEMEGNEYIRLIYKDG